MNVKDFPDYYKSYSWEGKHKLFGYPADTFPQFQWVHSLEVRFDWLKHNSASKRTASKYLLAEMIEWGGSQNGVLQKFNDGCGEANLLEILQNVLNNLSSPANAIDAALEFPGLGLTYASKLLRFLDPCQYGALDSRVRGALSEEGLLKKPIHDGHRKSMVDGYVAFLEVLSGIRDGLEKNRVLRPACSLANLHDGIWRLADIEMALFRWAAISRGKSGSAIGNSPDA